MTSAPALVGFAPPRRRWRTWSSAEPVLAGLDTCRLRAELAVGGPHRCDELLAALVRLAYDDSDAQTVVVGLLWPGISARAARYARPAHRDDAVALLVAELTEDLASGRHIEIGEFVAATVLERPTGRLRRALRRERDRDERTDHYADPNEAGADHELSPSAGLLLGLAVDAGVLSERDAWLVHVTDIDGHSLRWAARQLAISYPAAVKRRQRAKAAWKAWWDCDRERTREAAREERRAS